MSVGPGEIRQTLLRSVENKTAGGDADEIVDAVLEALLSNPVIDEIARTIEVAQDRADNAWSLRDDIFDCPDGPEPRARIAVAALKHALGQRESAEVDLEPESAQSTLDSIDYKGWRFQFLRLPDGNHAVRVTATVENSHDPSRTFTVSRRGFGRQSLLENALRAVLVIEEHEARERFRVNGRRIFDPHSERSWDPIPIPNSE